VQEELELLVVTLSLDLHYIMEVSLLVRLERNVHLDRETCSEWALHVVLDLELDGLGAGEFQPSDALTDVSDCDSHLIVLVGLDVFEKDLWREDLNGLRRVAQMVYGRVV